MSSIYTLQASSTAPDVYIVLRQNNDGTITSIPPDPANTDFVAYTAWLAEGNTPNPYVPPPEPAPLTPAEKLAAAGLSVDELKSLLGL